MNARDSATHGAHEDERWREAKRRRIRELEAENQRLQNELNAANSALGCAVPLMSPSQQIEWQRTMRRFANEGAA